MRRSSCFALAGCAALAAPAVVAGGNFESAPMPTYAYEAWRDPVVGGDCSMDGAPVNISIPEKTGAADGVITCAREDGMRV
jgi:hypothetical protein